MQGVNVKRSFHDPALNMPRRYNEGKADNIAVLGVIGGGKVFFIRWNRIEMIKSIRLSVEELMGDSYSVLEVTIGRGELCLISRQH